MPGYPCCCGGGGLACAANYEYAAIEDSPCSVENCGIQFTDTSTPTPGETIVGWLWEFGDGGTSLEQNPIHYFPQSGTYATKLTTTDSANCITSHTKNISVSCDPLCCDVFIPEIGIAIPSSLSCPAGTYSLTNHCLSGGAYNLGSSAYAGCHWGYRSTGLHITARITPPNGFYVRLSADTAASLRDDFSKTVTTPPYMDGAPFDCAQFISDHGSNIPFTGPGASFRYCTYGPGNSVSLLL